MKTRLSIKEKGDARKFFQTLTQVTKDWNRVTEGSDEFKKLEKQIEQMLAEVTVHE